MYPLDPLDQFPLLQKPGRRPGQLQMGLQPLSPAEWIEVDPEFVPQVLYKAHLLQQHHAALFAALPGSLAAQQELLELLLEHLQTYFPNLYGCEAEQIINHQTQQIWRRSDFAAAPLDLAGRLVQEDLALLAPGNGGDHNGYELVAGSICFPLHWSLAEKLGRPLTQIHEPVPGYATQLSRPVDGLFDRLRPQQPVWRMNWSITTTPELCLVPGLVSQPIDPATVNRDNAGEKLWLRLERQTLQRLPRSGNIVFSIHSHICPLQRLATHREMAEQLAQTIPQLPPAILAYKNITPVKFALLGYLDRICAALATGAAPERSSHPEPFAD